jgi:hypothetical protein
MKGDEMNTKMNKMASLCILAIVIVFGAYTFHLREKLKSYTQFKVTQEMCEEFITHNKNIKDITLFEKDVKELKSLEIIASRDAFKKIEWKAVVTTVDEKGFETNNPFKEYEFFALIKKIESLLYKIK